MHHTIFYSVKKGLYRALVCHDPQIRAVYEEAAAHAKASGRRSRIHSLSCLFGLHLQKYLLGRPLAISSQPRHAPRVPAGESFRYASPETLAKRLSAYDVISFDIFDTLLFRPFSDPKDLFYLVGEKLGVLGFRELRIQAEKRLRAANPGKEITLLQIYRELSRHAGIDPAAGAAAEFAVESSLCRANPYLFQVVSKLAGMGKTLVAASDMYLDAGQCESLLRRCGYHDFVKVYVSSQGRGSKHGGALYRQIRREFGAHLRYAHIGDNFFADVKMARWEGFSAIYYPNINRLGNPARPGGMSPLVGSAYRGISNALLCCGRKKYSLAYEYGLLRGGLFVLGYCHFIHRYAISHQIDRVLFFSRDGEILKRVYDLLYPGNGSKYVAWSRLAALKMTAHRNPSLFFERMFLHKSGTGITVKQALLSADLYPLFRSHPLPFSSPLDHKNVHLLQKAIRSRWPEVLQIYAQQSQAAKQYYHAVLEGCKKVCAVDIGWVGSGAISLMQLAEQDWGVPCKVYGLLAGTMPPHFPGSDSNAAFLQSGRLHTYLFSPSLNRELLLRHHPGAGDNLYLEFLLSSPGGTLIGFYPDQKGGCRAVTAPHETPNPQTIRDIQRGILDFARAWDSWFSDFPYMSRISGSDAYLPFRQAADDAGYLRAVLNGCRFQAHPGGPAEPIL